MPKPLTDNPALAEVVYRNQWREVFDGTVPEGWEPTLKVSVVTAAYNSKTLDLTMASLAAQDYPEHLLEVVVIDDGSEPAVELGSVVHPNTRLVRVGSDEGWGRSNALRMAIEATDGDIVYWVDSDMILFRDNVREHAKWAHFIPEAATIGHKGFVEEWDFTPEQVFAEVKDDSIRRHHDLSTLHRHWSLDVYDETDDLNASAGRNYSTHMGACATVTRAVYDRTNGQDPDLKLGDDTHIAYEIWQAGGVFIPVQSAETYHLGRATIQDQADTVATINDVYLGERLPIPRFRRRAENRQWRVPFLTVVVEIDRDTAHLARECVDRVLNSYETDLHVILVGPWDTLSDGRRRVLADPDVQLHLTREWYAQEGRVTLATEAPVDVFPSPFRLDLPVRVGVGADSIKQMIQQCEDFVVGVVKFLAPEGADVDDTAVLTFTAAHQRARAYVSDEVSWTEALDAVWGVEWRPGADFDLVHLPDVERIGKFDRIRRLDPHELAAVHERLEVSKELRSRDIAKLRAAKKELEIARNDVTVKRALRRLAGRVKRKLKRTLKRG